MEYEPTHEADDPWAAKLSAIIACRWADVSTDRLVEWFDFTVSLMKSPDDPLQRNLARTTARLLAWEIDVRLGLK